MNISINDFHPYSSWQVDEDGPIWRNEEGNLGKMHIIDDRTGKKYLNQRPCNIWLKCFMLAVGSPAMQIPILAIKILARLGGVFAAFATGKTLKAKVKEASKNLLIIIAMPLIYIALELSAVYGLVNPSDGRKIYATFERLAGKEIYLAPCFQPDAQSHFFGDDINNPNGY